MPIPLLGQVDDLLGVAEAGYKSKQLNAYVNVKTANKDLQFGSEKCSYIMISKVVSQVFKKSDLFVDSWNLNHKPDGTF